MNIEAEKLSVLQQIINTNDLDLIRDIKQLLNSKQVDWFDGLSKVQRNDVEEGIAQLDKGEVLTHEDVKMKFNLYP
ncbi:hypothetical protein [Pedobacter cryotolerans]|uniref:Addiction module component n=1 Tax=Pedobacter cryotolerans TaxID=2571270 RepID=A0A4U1CD14_9SPHI|nr:hypothetical protein [Pedobacter cryotolerans]TKC03147.1 hypothetical protein FA045_00840 [Pedobacter cryotolerans]